MTNCSNGLSNFYSDEWWNEGLHQCKKGGLKSLAFRIPDNKRAIVWMFFLHWVLFHYQLINQVITHYSSITYWCYWLSINCIWTSTHSTTCTLPPPGWGQSESLTPEPKLYSSFYVKFLGDEQLMSSTMGRMNKIKLNLIKWRTVLWKTFVQICPVGCTVSKWR